MTHARWKVFVNYEKEEVWLNEMAAKGFAFVDFILCRYTFMDCEPGEYTYRIELLENLSSTHESKRYLSFMAENGVEHIASWARWVYFRKRASDGVFDIYSDIESRIVHYRRISILWLVLMFCFLIMAVTQLMPGIDYLLSGQYVSSLAFHLTLGAFFLCFTATVLINWNQLRRKIKQLKLEKQLRE